MGQAHKRTHKLQKHPPLSADRPLTCHLSLIAYHWGGLRPDQPPPSSRAPRRVTRASDPRPDKLRPDVTIGKRGNRGNLGDPGRLSPALPLSARSTRRATKRDGTAEGRRGTQRKSACHSRPASACGVNSGGNPGCPSRGSGNPGFLHHGEHGGHGDRLSRRGSQRVFALRPKA